MKLIRSFPPCNYLLPQHILLTLISIFFNFINFLPQVKFFSLLSRKTHRLLLQRCWTTLFSIFNNYFMYVFYFHQGIAMWKFSFKEFFMNFKEKVPTPWQQRQSMMIKLNSTEILFTRNSSTWLFISNARDEAKKLV